MWTRIGPSCLALAAGVGCAATLVVACAAESPPAAPADQTTTEAVPPPSRDDDAMTAAADAKETLTLGRPVTVRVPLSDELLAVVRGHDADAGDAPSLRLTLDGLETPERPVSVRVFINHPEATADTPLDDPRYLGDVGFFPTGDYGGMGELPVDSNFLLDVGSNLAEMAPAQRVAEERYVDVTLIAVPLEEHAKESVGDVEIAFSGVKLSVHEVDGGAPGD